MPKYTPSFVDIGAFNKAFTEQLYRNAQINIRREQIIDKDIDDFRRTYNGKVRDIDRNDFNNNFQEYEKWSKLEQKANRGGYNSRVLSEVSSKRQQAKMAMEDVSNESIALGQLQKSLSTIPKAKILDTDLYQATMNDLATKGISEIKQKYGSIDKIPQIFKFKVDQFDIKDFNNAVKSSLSLISKPDNLKYVPAMKDGKRMTVKKEIKVKDIKGKEHKSTEDIPLKIMKFTSDPLKNRAAVDLAAKGVTKNLDFLNNYKNETVEKSTNAADAVSQKDASELLSFAMTTYGKPLEDLTGIDLYAAKVTRDADIGEIYEEDYDALFDDISLIAQKLNLEQKSINIAESKNAIRNSNKMVLVNKLNSLLNLYDKGVGLGMYDDVFISELNEISKQAGSNIRFDRNSMETHGKNKATQLKSFLSGVNSELNK
jgi:hypothetical protein